MVKSHCLGECKTAPVLPLQAPSLQALRRFCGILSHGIRVVLVDLDDRRDCASFKNELSQLLSYCPQQPKALFRIAIEELEAWFLGDQEAIKQAYPHAKQQVLDAYVQDSQCGTWEKLADAIYPGGLTALGQHGKRSVRILEQKRIWAKEISPLLDVQTNQSPSFKAFRDGVRRMASV